MAASRSLRMSSTAPMESAAANTPWAATVRVDAVSGTDFSTRLVLGAGE